MSGDILQYLSKKIGEELKVIEADTALGKATSFEDYKFACGIYRGLLLANSIIIETAQKMEHDDE